MNELKEFKAKKEGLITVGGVVEMLNENKESFERVVVIGLNNDGEVIIYESASDSALKTLGMIECGKHAYINGLYHEY